MTAVDVGVRTTDDMLQTMYDAPGIGLAAIRDRRAAPPPGDRRRPTARRSARDAPVFINPEHRPGRRRRRSVYDGGCLSIPDYYAEVERPARVRVRLCRSLPAQARTSEADGLLATCLQHEIDHLNGVLFIDHISQAEARPGDPQVHQGRQAAGDDEAGTDGGQGAAGAASVQVDGAARRLPGHAGLRPAGAAPRSCGQGHEVAAVYTRAEPAPAGRGMELSHARRCTGSPTRFGIPVLTPRGFAAMPRSPTPSPRFEADVAVVVAYGLILPKVATWRRRREGCLNLHALAAAALARRGADQARRHGRRRARPASW